MPFTAGGPTDTLARTMSEPMRRVLGQAIIVDNTTGAGGSIGVGCVVRSPPDGYTLSIGHWGTHVVNGAYYKPTYDLLTDLEPVAMIATNPQMVIARSVLPAANLKELVQWIKANQGKIQIGTGDIGSSSHIGGLYFLNRVGVKMEFVLIATPNSSSTRPSSIPSPIPPCASVLPTWARKFRRWWSRHRALAVYHKAEIDKWWPLMKAAGIKAQ